MKLSHKIPTYGSIVIIRLAAEAAAGRESVKYNNTHPTFLFNITDDLVEAINGLSEAKNVPKLCMHHQSAKQPYYNMTMLHLAIVVILATNYSVEKSSQAVYTAVISNVWQLMLQSKQNYCTNITANCICC